MSLCRSALLAVVLLSVLTGCEVECETNQDCPTGTFRCVNNACVLPEVVEAPDFGFVPQIDVGFPDVRDLGTPDRGAMADLGGDDAGDAGTDGGGDADTDGGGDAGDTGVSPSPLNDIEALVQVGIIRSSPDVTGGTALGRIVDYSQSGRTIEVDPPRPVDGCVVIRRGPGTAAGLTASRIEVSNGVQINLLPTTSPGVFRDQTQTDPALLIQPGAQVSYRIVSTGATGTLGAVTTTTPLPPADSPLLEVPAPGSLVTRSIIGIPNLALAGANAYAVYDADRRKVIECPITLSTIEIASFIDTEFPSGEVTLDIRSDAEITVSVPVIGRGSIPVTFRATRGVRYRLLIP